MGIGGVFCAQSHARVVLAGILVCDAAPHVHASVLSGTRSAGVPCVPTEATMNAAGNHNFLYGTHRIFTLLHVTYGICSYIASLTATVPSVTFACHSRVLRAIKFLLSPPNVFLSFGFIYKYTPYLVYFQPRCLSCSSP